MTHYIYIIATLLMLTACQGNATNSSAGAAGNSTANSTSTNTQTISFVGDSAYAAVAAQLDFGPRVPGSEAHQQCAAWLRSELERYGAKVSEHRTSATAYDGTRLPVINLMGSYNPEARHRVLLMAHWDSRHVADQDPDPKRRNEPVMAANDGASGVGVLLEIARLAGKQQPRCGIDIFLTDAEDYGAPDSWSGRHSEDDWALGTQIWCREQLAAGYTATYGILLDMVGSGEATFYREYYSDRYASDVVDLVWATASKLGYTDLFVNRHGAGITDDHTFVNRILGIPTIDIIDTRADGSGTFYPHWHTTDDTLDKISTETLQKVGNVLVKLLWGN